ncbi:hypothetical protein ACFL5X_02515 [Candidatus Omnitrophota bacterium]
MVEETKQKQCQSREKQCGCGFATTGLKVIVGLAFIGVGVWAVLTWWTELLSVVKGGIGLLLILVGAITIAIARD